MWTSHNCVRVLLALRHATRVQSADSCECVRTTKARYSMPCYPSMEHLQTHYQCARLQLSCRSHETASLPSRASVLECCRAIHSCPIADAPFLPPFHAPLTSSALLAARPPQAALALLVSPHVYGTGACEECSIAPVPCVGGGRRGGERREENRLHGRKPPQLISPAPAPAVSCTRARALACSPAPPHRPAPEGHDTTRHPPSHRIERRHLGAHACLHVAHRRDVLEQAAQLRAQQVCGLREGQIVSQQRSDPIELSNQTIEVGGDA